MSETNYHNTKFFTENYTYAYTYLVGDDSEDKNYKNCLKATQLENEINYSPKKRHWHNFFCYKRKHKQFIKNNKSISKTQQRFRNKKHNVFKEELHVIALGTNDDRMQPIEMIGT